MSLIELFLLAAGLSMDAFAVSVCKGLSMQKMRAKHALVIGLYFGGFQASCLDRLYAGHPFPGCHQSVRSLDCVYPAWHHRF